MVRTSTQDATRDLAEFDEKLRRGAELIVKGYGRQSSLLLLMMCLLGLSRDVPASWQWLAGWALLITPLVLIVLLVRPRRALPLRHPLSRRTVLLICLFAVAAIGLQLGIGAALRHLEVPLPHTLGNVLVALIAMAAAWRFQYSSGGYVGRVVRGRW